MRLRQVNPLSFQHKFGSRYNRIFDRNFLLGRDPFDTDYFRLPANIREQQEYYEIEIPLSGYKKDQISINIENNILTITGEKESDTEKISNYIIKEHDLDCFERSFQLSDITDQNNITSTFEDGILYVKLHHVDEKPIEERIKEIPIY